MTFEDIIIGQECICPDGLGRVHEVREGVAGSIGIFIDTYINNRCCNWDSRNVKLIPPVKTNFIMATGHKEALNIETQGRRFEAIGIRTGIARTREEAVERIHKGLNGDLDLGDTCYHYGKMELRDLMDFIYGEKPQNEKQEI